MSRDKRPQKQSGGKRALQVLGFLIGVPGIVASFVAILPRLSISPQPPLVSSDAFTAPFMVSNDGYFSLYKVNAGCSPKGIAYVEPGHPKHRIDLQQTGRDEDETGGVLNENLEVAELLPAHKNAFPCVWLNVMQGTRVPPEWLDSANILMVVRYHTTLLPFIQRYYRQRFELTRDSSGQYRWIEQPFK